MADSHAVVLDDTAAARAELRGSQYGEYAHAEELIRGHWASITPEVRASVRKRRNEEAIREAKEAGVADKIEVPKGGKLIDWTIRGKDPSHQVISFVWQDSTGRLQRGIQGYSSDYTPPEETEQERIVREVAMHDSKVKSAAADAQAELETKLAEFREELRVEQAKALQSMQAELVATLKETLGGIAEPAPSSADDGSDDGQGSGSASTGSTGGESQYPRQHDKLDQLAKGSGQALPSDWDDRNAWKVDSKIAFLQEHGVQPEAEG